MDKEHREDKITNSRKLLIYLCFGLGIIRKYKTKKIYRNKKSEFDTCVKSVHKILVDEYEIWDNGYI